VRWRLQVGRIGHIRRIGHFGPIGRVGRIGEGRKGWVGSFRGHVLQVLRAV